MCSSLALYVPRTRLRACCPPLVWAVSAFDHALFILVFLLPHAFNGDEELTLKRMLFWTLPVSLTSCSVRSMDRGPGLHWILVGPVCILHLGHSGLYLFARIATGSSQSVLIDMAAGSMLGFVIGLDMLIFLGAYVLDGRMVQDFVPSSLRSTQSQPEKPHVEVLTCLAESELVSLGQGDACAMCLQDLQVAESLGRLRCGHIFHEACLNEWMKHKSRAPYCPFRCSATYCRPVPSGTHPSRPVPSDTHPTERHVAHV